MLDSSHLILLCCLALLIDQTFGEYPNALHPVVWIGKSISWGQRLFLGRGPRVEWWGGFLLLFGVAGFFSLGTYGLLAWLSPYPWIQAVLGLYLLKSTFALKALGFAATSLGEHIQRGDIASAKKALRALCSRSADELDDEHLLEASISSLAENLSDSFVAPLFFLLIGGIPGAMFYRAVNTLDAMVGYKNHFRNLGFASARCDDLLNYIPARITTFLLLIVAWAAHDPWRYASRIAWQDHGKTPSPNGGWPMACMAGILQIQLRKPHVYTLGLALHKSTVERLERAWKLSKRAGLLAFALTLSGLLLRA